MACTHPIELLIRATGDGILLGDAAAETSVAVADCCHLLRSVRPFQKFQISSASVGEVKADPVNGDDGGGVRTIDRQSMVIEHDTSRNKVIEV